MSDVLLGVNIDHIATLRNARGVLYPDPIYAAFLAEQAGADCITVHLREDRRHITDRDIFLLRQVIQSYMNLEMSITDEIVSIACKLRPHFCCLVPENRLEITTEHGLNVLENKQKLCNIISRLKDVGICVSLFIDPDEKQISSAVDVGATYVELHTGLYALAEDSKVRMSEFECLKRSVEYAVSCGLKVNAGHGLNYHNVQLIAQLPIEMLHIGHAIISRSVFCGLFSAVRDMKILIKHDNRG